ncbi:MAG TPA: CheR family methyltransferase [Anaerolineae bacterium]|nr:CheR family methyltransferase [Anaerolineae bacterium]
MSGRNPPDRLIRSLSDSDYLRFCDLLSRACGLYFSNHRRSELEHGIGHAFAASTCTSLDEYYHALTDPHPDTVELDRLINAVTVNETHFFRDEGQFNALYTYVLPQLIEQQRATRTLRIWSAGCASGEEPYSVAMLVRELLPDVDQWSITILGTDINTEALNRARQGIYGEWAFRENRARQWRGRYFQQTAANRYELIPAVRNMVTFARLNLAEPCYPAFETNTASLNLILCRNVTIYFGKEVTTSVVARFHQALVEGGWLVAGHAEYSLETFRNFHARTYADAILYQRDGQVPALPIAQAWSVTPVPSIKVSVGWMSDAPSATARPVPSPHDTSTVPTAPLPTVAVDPIERARELLDYGQAEQACAILREQVRLHPNHVEACTLLGQAYANLGAWAEAEHWCRRATQNDLLASDAHYTLALVLQHQQKFDLAIESMRRVVYLNHLNVLGHYGLANLYHANRQHALAHKSLANTRRLLEGRAAEEMIPESGGITVGRLREAIARQQQQWHTTQPINKNA